jgi:hypothetical protein
MYACRHDLIPCQRGCFRGQLGNPGHADVTDCFLDLHGSPPTDLSPGPGSVGAIVFAAPESVQNPSELPERLLNYPQRSAERDAAIPING